MANAHLLYDYELEDKLRTAALGVLPMYSHLLESNPKASHEDIRYTIVRHIQEFGVTGVPHELLISPASQESLPEIDETDEKIIEDYIKQEEIVESIDPEEFETTVENEASETLIPELVPTLVISEEESDSTTDENQLIPFTPSKDETVIAKERHNIKGILAQF